MINFWIPSTKKELLMWFSNFYGRNIPKLSKMSKKQLYAIYFRIRSSVK